MSSLKGVKAPSEQHIRESNVSLAYQIKENMLNDLNLQKECSNNPSGEIQFFVRDYQLQIVSFIRPNQLMGKGLILGAAEETPNKTGLSKDDYKSIVSLLVKHIRNSKQNYHYCTFNFNYQMGKDNVLEDICLYEKYDNHLKRK